MCAQATLTEFEELIHHLFISYFFVWLVEWNHHVILLTS
jgi:hypothetical protein